MIAPSVRPADETTLPVDTETIRETYDTALNEGAVDSADGYEALRAELVGHIEPLILVVRALVPRMQQPSQKHVAALVLRQARERVDARPGPGARERARHIYDLATVCRALLTLHEYPGVLDEVVGPWPGTARTATFLRDRESVPAARRFVHAALVSWKMPELADTAELVVSELATNAVQHARRGAFRVTLTRLDGDRVRVAVIDHSRTLPEPADPGDDEDHGRGLAIVEALSQQWGTDPLNWGKRVWADLHVPPLPALAVPDVPIYTSRRAQVVYVLIVVTFLLVIFAGAAAQP